MLALTDKILLSYFKIRQRKIDKVHSNAAQYQGKILTRILDANKNTEFGKAHAFSELGSYEDYSSAIPVRRYEDYFPYIERMMGDEDNILCSDKIEWFAKSSGTSTGRSKYIPVSHKYLLNGHLKCAWDAASLIYNEDNRARLFADKSLIMGGSVERLDSGKHAGDISGIIIKHFPPIGRRFYTPDFETALLPDWDKKIKLMAEITSAENVTLVAGVPTWLIVLFEEILDSRGAENMLDIWPNLRSFLHGGVDFEPYRNQFKKYLPSDQVIYREVYNASEGYFAIQDNSQSEGMMLLCDNEIFFEFIPMDSYRTGELKAIDISQIELDKDYALVISNSSGLYRYLMGDVVRIKSLDPVRIKIVGRTESMINVFGEELSIHNVETALTETCKLFDCRVWNYTVGPRFMNTKEKGGHEWIIEFMKAPEHTEAFARSLDDTLRKLNSDYDAKRYGDLALSTLKLNVIEKGSFEKWMRSKGKYGGQNKVPRLRNDRSIIEEMEAMQLI